jgi:polyphosphate kinase 2 (PPK2 family)
MAAPAFGSEKVFDKSLYDVLLDEVSGMIEEEQNRKKRLWVRDWTGRRDSRGASTLFL